MLRFGIISEIDAEKGLARVNFDDDDIVSGFLPIAFPKTKDDSFSWALDVDEHVACLMDEHSENGVIIGAIYSKAKQPDGGNKDKFRIKFKDNTVIEYDRSAHKLMADVKGSVDVKATGIVTVETNSTATLKATSVTIDSASVEIKGTLSVNGDVTAGSTLPTPISLLTHKHIGVTTGGGTSGTPIP